MIQQMIVFKNLNAKNKRSFELYEEASQANQNNNNENVINIIFNASNYDINGEFIGNNPELAQAEQERIAQREQERHQAQSDLNQIKQQLDDIENKLSTMEQQQLYYSCEIDGQNPYVFGDDAPNAQHLYSIQIPFQQQLNLPAQIQLNNTYQQLNFSKLRISYINSRELQYNHIEQANNIQYIEDIKTKLDDMHQQLNDISAYL